MADWIRYIVVNIPNPRPLTPRWYMIGWLFDFTKYPLARCQIKFALYFDWLFFSLYLPPIL